MTSISTQILIVYCVDEPGVLDRVASVFRRRAFNIHSIAVGGCEREGLARMTIAMEGDADRARLAAANLGKLLRVVSVENVSGGPTIERELALLKLDVAAERRSEVLKICDVFRARVVDIGREALTVEITGTSAKIDGLVDVLAPFGISELARGGTLAMTRSGRVGAAQQHASLEAIAE